MPDSSIQSIKNTFVHVESSTVPKRSRFFSEVVKNVSSSSSAQEPAPVVNPPQPPMLAQETIEMMLPTSVMFRNIPNKYSPRELKDDIEEFIGTFNFFYMPVDMETSFNLGYCFINFNTNDDLLKFKAKYDGNKLPRHRNHKVCEVSIARIQGLQANLDHLSRSHAIKYLPDEYKPTIYQGITPIPFPQGPAEEAPYPQRYRRYQPKTATIQSRPRHE
jgi:RNA recognition motif 2